MEKFIISTAVKVKETQIEEARRLSRQWKVPYIERQKLTVNQLHQQYGNVFIVYSDRYEYLAVDGSRLFFHPNTAVIRIKSGKDPLTELVGTHKKVLDCTMGLAGDSIVMSFAHNHVTSLEHDSVIFEIVKKGLVHFDDVDDTIYQAMQKIVPIETDFVTYLKAQDDNSFDVVYFDPMFTHVIVESKNINGIKSRQSNQSLTQEIIMHAKRVTKEKVIIKAHYKDDVFERLGFKRIVRENTKFHYGVIQK